jgi:hypothetical protein
MEIRAGAGWLFSDADVVYKMVVPDEEKHFVSVKMKVNPDSTAVVDYEDGDLNKLYQQKYKYTDFPKGEFKFYIIDNVMLLPSEY